MSIFLIGVDQMMGSIHFGDRIAWIWRSGAYRNLLLIAMIAAAILPDSIRCASGVLAERRTSGPRAPVGDGLLCYPIGLCIGWIAR